MSEKAWRFVPYGIIAGLVLGFFLDGPFDGGGAWVAIGLVGGGIVGLIAFWVSRSRSRRDETYPVDGEGAPSPGGYRGEGGRGAPGGYGSHGGGWQGGDWGDGGGGGGD